MPYQVLGRHLEEVVVLRPEAFSDDRGLFMETWRADQFAGLGLPDRFAQENQSRSRRGVVRGLHFQWDPPMGKLMRVTAGRAWLVAVDLRHDSPTIGKHFGLEVDASSGVMVWAPPSFARGFCALEEGTDVLYKCTGAYNPKGESGILWNDPAIGIAWPLREPILSAKDATAQTLEAWLARPESRLFRRAGASS
jgi:dTDP-4-dehydrorhamnose 3,5-epimerase